jgi:hypothetical protein
VLDTLAKAPPDLSSSQRRRGRQRYISRCHVADIAAVLLASMDAPGAHGGTSSSGRSSGESGGGDALGAAAIFNIADDEPAAREEVEAFARGLLGAPEPAAHGQRGASGDAGAGDAEAGDTGGGGGGAGGSRGGGGGALEEKRVRNARIKSALGVSLKYPTYREGLAAIAAGGADPFAGWVDVRALTGAAGPPRL